MRANTERERASVGEVNIVPAPWKLRAEGYVLAIKLPMPRGRAELFARTELEDARFGQFGCVMFIEYSASPVGPYRELLFIPGTFRFGNMRLPSITKIYVSSRASVDSGQHNWGIPKELADFDVVTGGDGIKRVTMRVGGRTAVELWLRHRKLALPVTTSLMPRAMRTLGQVHEGHTYTVSPDGHCLVQRANVVHAWSAPGMFADFTAERVVAALRCTKVELNFPAAAIT